MNVVLTIRALTVGGAERQLVNLAIGLKRLGHAVRVVVFYDERTPLAAELDTAGVELMCIGKRSRWDLLGPLLRYRAMLTSLYKPVVYSFLPVSNLFSALVTATVRDAQLAWGVRDAGVIGAAENRFGKRIAAIQKKLHGRAALIIANSAAARDAWHAGGVPLSKLAVIPNGIDSARFSFSAEGRAVMRRAWAVTETDLAIGIVGRLATHKGLYDFLLAASLVRAKRSDVRFVVIGRGESDDETKLRARSKSLGLDASMIWAGQVLDMVSAYSALDIVCMASHYEGSPNVLAEAMLCGTQCVSTDVGNARQLIGDDRYVANIRDPSMLAARLIHAADNTDSASRERRRERVLDMCSLSAMLQQTETALLGLVTPSTSKSRG